MEKEKFILKQLQRNVGIYKVCLLIFRIVMAAVILAAILSLTGLVKITLAVYEGMIFAAVGLQYPAFRRLKAATEKAAEEVEKALETPDFRIPDDYSPETQFARSKTVQDPKTVASQIFGFGFMGAVMLGFGIWLLIFECIKVKDPPLSLNILAAILLAASVPMIVLTVRYAVDYKAAKEIARHENGGK